MTVRSLVLAFAASLALVPVAAFADDATPTPPPAQEPSPAPTAREGWVRPGTASRERERREHHGWGEGSRDSDRDEELTDPNQDSVFYFPTGRTLRGGQLSLGFPGSGGAPDIQYGLTNFLQVGAGYTLFGFTPEARLGLIRGRRVDFSLVGGAYLPAGTTHPFYGQFGGGVFSAGRDEFRVHLGYQWMQAWGTPFPDVKSVTGGLGTTGVEIKIAPQAKFLFLVENFAQLDPPKGVLPFYAIAVSPGVRVWSRNLSADVGVIAGQAYNVKLKRDDVPSSKAFVLPMLTLRYQL